MLAALRRQGLNQSQIARTLGRHRSTVCRELCRNSTRADGHYRAFTAQERTNGGSVAKNSFSPNTLGCMDSAKRNLLRPKYFLRHYRRK